MTCSHHTPFLLLLAISIVVVTISANNPDVGLVRHFVAFRFKNETTVLEKKQIMQSYTSLKDKCKDVNGRPYIVSFDGGFPNSKEGFQQGMEQSYIVTFKSVADRYYFVGRPFTYPYDPDHDAFKQFVGPFLYDPIAQGLIVIDFPVVNLP